MLLDVSSTMPMRRGKSVGWLNAVISCWTPSSKTLKSSLFKSVTSFSRLVTTLNNTSTRLTLRTMVPCRSVWGGACAGAGGGAEVGGGDCCAKAVATANSTIGIAMRRARLFMSVTNRAQELSQDYRGL